MKQTFTLFALFLFTSISQAQITHIDYGEGWSIPVNADIPFDINEDGRIDFYINKKEDELGFSPQFIVGCLASPSGSAYVPFGAREMSIFEEGEPINGSDLDFDTFIDDDRGSNWHRTDGFAPGWEDNEERYIGFILLRDENGPIMASNGWIKLKVDSENESLIILELAYEEQLNVPIITGAITTSVENVLVVDELTISPNPATDLINVSLDYSGDELINISVYNDVGQKIMAIPTKIPNGKSALDINVSDLSNGYYYLVLNAGDAIKTKRFAVIK